MVIKAHEPLKGVIGLLGNITMTSPSVYPSFLTEWLKLHRAFDAANITAYNYFHYPQAIFANLLPVPHDAPESLEYYEKAARDTFKSFAEWAEKNNETVSWKLEVTKHDNWFDFWNGPFDAHLGELDAVAVSYARTGKRALLRLHSSISLSLPA